MSFFAARELKLIMGRSYLFECPKCSYQAKVSGGEDSGFEVFVQTAACRDCRMLFDAVVRWRMPDTGLKITSELQRFRLRKSQTETPPTLETALSRLPPVDIRKFKWVSFKIRCPVSPAHRAHAWNEPGKCPRCGTYLEKNALPFRYWD
jgi:hypothetical protein